MISWNCVDLEVAIRVLTMTISIGTLGVMMLRVEAIFAIVLLCLARERCFGVEFGVVVVVVVVVEVGRRCRRKELFVLVLAFFKVARLEGEVVAGNSKFSPSN